MNNDIIIAQNDLKELEKLRKEEQGLLNNFSFLPTNYQEEKINEKITSLDDAIRELQAKVSRFKELSDTHSLDDSAVLMTLDKAVRKMEELILERENFQKYKSINNQMQWMQLKNGVWEAVWGVKYGNICYDNGYVYVYSGSAGTEAPGGKNWIRMTAFSKW